MSLHGGHTQAAPETPLSPAPAPAPSPSPAFITSSTFSPYRIHRQSPQNTPSSDSHLEHAVRFPSVFCLHWWHVKPAALSYSRLPLASYPSRNSTHGVFADPRASTCRSEYFSSL